MSEHRLLPITALIQDGGAYELRIRWVLGETGNSVPRPDDAFDVSVELVKSHRFLRADGTFGAPGDAHSIAVKPRRFAMIDPPRQRMPYPLDGQRFWEVATTPAAGVDCNAIANSTVVGGFGVCHLLSGTQRSRALARVEALLADHVDRAQAAIAARTATTVRTTDGGLRTMADMLVHHAPRPVYLAGTLREQHAKLVAATRAAANDERWLDTFAFGGGTIEEQWRQAALTAEVFRDRTLIVKLDEIITPPEKIRQQLRMRALQGGTLIDFWCSPDAPTTCADANRGRQYPASELIGCGITIGSFTPDDVRDWLNSAGPGDDIVSITVRHIRVVRPGDVIKDADGNVIEIITDADAAFDPGTFVLSERDLRIALSDGTTLPPAAPRETFVNYDFLQTNAGTEGPVQLAHVTGDARVEILITPGIPPTYNRMTFGFNVYGMWEIASTQRFFDDPNLSPTMAELRPWLITRRYSYERDLKGAFPAGGGGADHPGLTGALANPPWQAVLVRINDVLDQNDDPIGKPLPDVFRTIADGTRQTRVSLDLRVGMDSGASASGRKFVGWDPEGPPRVSWDPKQTREGTAAGTEPQRYRFWVTAIDPFEQESKPVPVLAHDAEGGETTTTLFTPRRRAALLPPPAFDATTNPTGRTLELTPQANGAFTLTVKWETPFLNDLGRSEDTPGSARRADKRELVGAIKLFRRRLRKKVEEEPLSARAALFAQSDSGDVFTLPQWITQTDGLVQQGWTEIARDGNVAPPAGNEVWSRAFAFDHSGRGFEYLALAAVSVKSDAAAFWAPDAVKKRTAWRAEKVADKWVAVKDQVTETPRTSAVIATERWVSGGTSHAGALPVPNPAEPRGTELLAARFHAAKPVLPPPGVRRDTVLLRLLTRSVADTPPQPWADTGIVLTAAQAAMIETALERTAAQAGIADPLHDPRLAGARRLLAVELQSEDSGPTSYRQHPAIGFRGLTELQWRYTPFAVSPPGLDEAEAERVRIFSVRVSDDAAAAARFATVLANGTLQSGVYTLPNIPAAQKDGLATIAVFRQPALVRIQAGQQPPIFGALTEITVNGATAKIRVDAGGVSLPASATIGLYVAQPLLDAPIERADVATNTTIFLPFGGGRAEHVGYWLQTSSAQEVVSGHSKARRPFFIVEGLPTVEPEAPLAVRVSHPAKSAPEWALDPNTEREWMPNGVTTPNAAQHDPRIVIAWNAYPASDRIGIEIEREERLVEQDNPLLRLALDAVSPWEAIKNIDMLADDLPLRAEWIAAIRNTWLLGTVVEIPDEDRGNTTGILIPASLRPLSGTSGLRRVTLPGAPDAQPAFIDYFRLVNNGALVMDGNYEYRYRLRAYIDVLNGAPSGGNVDFRFLRSAPTAWSEWILPEPSSASVTNDPPTFTNLASASPAICLLFTPAAAKSRIVEQPPDGWLYRVVIKRLLDFALPSSEATSLDAEWREVGGPVVVRPEGGEVPVLDATIERPDVDRIARVRYRLTVRQIVMTPSGRERLVRVLDKREVRIDVPPPADPEGDERMATVVVHIA